MRINPKNSVRKTRKRCRKNWNW